MIEDKTMSRLFEVTIILFALLFIAMLHTSGCNFIPKVTTGGEGSTPSTSPAEQLMRTVWKTNWMTTLAIPIIALGAVLLFNGAMKVGVSTIIFGVISLFMTLATARFAFWMALFGFIGSTAAVVLSILIKNKALKDVVTNVEAIKTIAKNNTTAEVYRDIKNELAGQANSSKKLISKIKPKLKIKSEEIKCT